MARFHVLPKTMVGIREELLFICTANMAVWQNIATSSRCCVKNTRAPFKKDKKKRKKLVNPLVKSCEKLLLTNFLTLISKLARELH